MKNLIYISLALILFSSCGINRQVVKTNTVITREVDTLLSIDPVDATFIPIEQKTELLPIVGRSIEVLKDSVTGQEMTIYYKEVMPKPNVPVKQIEKIEMHIPERKVAVKMHETIETNTKVKTITGIPWFYKAALWFTLIVVAIFLIKKFLF